MGLCGEGEVEETVQCMQAVSGVAIVWMRSVTAF